LKKKRYVLVRTYSAGVHAGYFHSRNGQEVTLTNTRRIWYWDGAASLSQIAVSGVSKPQNCKFSVVVSKNELLQAIEVMDCTEEARKNIESVSSWKA